MEEMPATQASTSDVGHAIPAEPEQQLRADTYRLLGHLLAAPPGADAVEVAGADSGRAGGGRLLLMEDDDDVRSTTISIRFWIASSVRQSSSE